MIHSVLAALAFAGQAQPVELQPPFYGLAKRPNEQQRLAYYWLNNPMGVTKLSPRKFGPTAEPYTFDWVVAGFVRPSDKPENLVNRFRVYNQIKPKRGDETFMATAYLLRLWETLQSWGADHTYDYGGGVVDLYLCWGGTPGGEANFDNDPQVPKTSNSKVATMYIYDLPSFKTPVERVREVAHEYGHLVLPSIGGYSDPEEWANGILGERLFLVQLARDLESNAIPATDAFGVTPDELDVWLAKNVLPHRDRAAIEGPFAPRFAKRDGAGLSAFVGEASFLQAMLPANRFGRALRLMETQSASALIKSAALAMDEGGVEMKIPATLKGKTIWVPIGKTKLTGGKILARRSGWAKVQPAGSTLTLKL